MRVVIVGAGLAGTSVAWHLAPHADVVLIDAGAAPGQEASSQNAGMVRRMGEDPGERALAMRTHEWLCDPPDGFDGVSRVRGAVLGLAHDRWHLHDAASHLRARGVVPQPSEVPAHFAPVLDGSPLPFAWVLPNERVADPAALIAGFLTRDLTLRLGERVVELVRDGERVTGVRTDKGRVQADAVVIAAGAWSGSLAEHPLTPVRRCVFQTGEHPLATDEHPWVWLDDVGLYARPWRGRWWVSACEEQPAHDPLLPGSTGVPSASDYARAVARIRRWMPALGELSIERAWSGLRTFAPDRRPVLGEDLRSPGLWWAAGLGGYGVTCSVAVGEAVSRWMLGQETPWLERQLVRPDRAQATRWAVRESGALHEARLRPVR